MKVKDSDRKHFVSKNLIHPEILRDDKKGGV